MGALAQFEKELLVERTNAGLVAAHARGRVGGRPRALDEKGVATVRKLYRSNEYSVPEIATMLNVSAATVYRNLDPTLKSALENVNQTVDSRTSTLSQSNLPTGRVLG